MADDADEHVSLWAASHCLWFDADMARRRLRYLSVFASTGFVRFGAYATLKEFDDGNLRDPRQWYRTER